MDHTGKIVIPPKFDSEGDYFSDLACVEMDSKWGYANERGNVVIPFQFDGAGNFSDGLAPVLVGRRWGYIDLSGQLAVAPRFQGTAAFHEGFARVEVWESARCDNRSYSNEDAPISFFRGSGCTYSNQLFGFIDRVGKLLVAPQFSNAGDFSEGLANIQIDDTDGPRWGFIDKAGNRVIPPRFSAVSPFSEGLAAVCLDKGRCGFIDRTGTFAIPAKFPGVDSFSEGLAVAASENGLQGFIDKRGDFVIGPRFVYAESFSEGLAIVRPEMDQAPYYVDKNGRKALQLKPWTRWRFSDGLTVGGEWGHRMYLDRKGRTVAPYEVDPHW